MRVHTRHAGATLTELLLYLGILAVVAVLTIPILFTTAENRLLQQTIAIVDLSGTQAVQSMVIAIREAERILYPAPGETGTYLALRMQRDELHPVLFGVDGGRIVKITHATRELLTSTQVAVEDFTVRNTSVSGDRPSVAIDFRVSRTIRLEQPRSYDRSFEAALTLSPADVPADSACAPACAPPSCTDASTVAWQVCQEVPSGAFRCLDASTSLVCE